MSPLENRLLDGFIYCKVSLRTLNTASHGWVGLGLVGLGWDGMGWDGKEETRTHSRSTAVIWYEATRVLVRDLTLIMVAELVHAW